MELEGGRTARRLDPRSDTVEDELQAVTELTSCCFQTLNGPPLLDKVRGWTYRWKTLNLLKTFVGDPARFFVLVVHDPAHPGPEPGADGAPSQVSSFTGKPVAADGVVDGIVASCDCTLLYPGAQIQQGLKLWNPRYSLKHMVYISSMAVASTIRRQGVASALLDAVEEESLRHFSGTPPSFLALYVYDENDGAKDLYFKAGFEVAREDPWYAPIWTLQPRRLLLVKEVARPLDPGAATWVQRDGGDAMFGGPAGGAGAGQGSASEASRFWTTV